MKISRVSAARLDARPKRGQRPKGKPADSRPPDAQFGKAGAGRSDGPKSAAKQTADD